MVLVIDRKAKTEWFLVKAPQIREGSSGKSVTAALLRETIQENHFGGEKATARRLTQKETAYQLERLQ